MKPRRLVALACFARLRIGDEFEDETGRRQGEQAGERKKDVAPAEQIAEHAAGSLPEKLAENVA